MRLPTTITLLLLVGKMAAQPLPPMPVEYGPFEPEAPITHTATVQWNKYVQSAGVATGLLLVSSNAATNLVVSLPIDRTNYTVVLVEGSNSISLSATNSFTAGKTNIMWYATLDRYQRLFAESAIGPLGPWEPVPMETITNSTGIKFLRTGITNWTKWGGQSL